MFTFGNPIILEKAGRIKTDPINQDRIDTVLTRFEEWAKINKYDQNLRYIVNKQQRDKSFFAFPLAGFAFGVLSSQAFVHPNSKYIGKFFTLLTTYIGYIFYQKQNQAYNFSRRFTNFWSYPIEIRRMIDNNDSRYAFKWLKDDYLSIEAQQ